MTADIELKLKNDLSYKILDKRNCAALLSDSGVRESLEAIFEKYNIDDVDQIYDLCLDNDLSYLLELYYFDRTIKRDDQENFKKNALGLYYRDISKYTLLSKEKEVELFTKYNESSNPEEKAEIKKEIANANLRLVISIARDYVNRGLDLEDLISEGNIGLLMSIDRFDVNLGYKFSTYAEFWIKRAITGALFDKSKVIRIPVNLFKKMMKVNMYLDKYYECNGKEMPLTEENLNMVAQDLGITMYAVVATLNYKEVMSLDQPVFINNCVTPLSDIIPSTDISVEDEVLYNKQIEEIGNIMEKELTDRDRRVVLYRLGVGDGRPKTFKEIASLLGLSKEAIRYINTKSINKIKSELNMQDLKYRTRK